MRYLHKFGYFVFSLFLLSTAGVTLVPRHASEIPAVDPSRAVEKSQTTFSGCDRVNPNGLGDLRLIDENALRYYSDAYGVDFRLILAVIKQESKFDKEAVSAQGAEGLMQIMPVVHSDIMEELGVDDMYVPIENLHVGIYYFAKMFDLFDQGSLDDRMRLSLAAYNAGPRRVYDAQVIAAYLGENPREWSSIANVLPLLSKRYYSLHQSVWAKGKPSGGYFGSSKQSIEYVSAVMKTYHSYLEEE